MEHARSELVGGHATPDASTAGPIGDCGRGRSIIGSSRLRASETIGNDTPTSIRHDAPEVEADAGAPSLGSCQPWRVGEGSVDTSDEMAGFDGRVGGRPRPGTTTLSGLQPNGVGVEEVVADKGYHSDATLVALDTIGVRSHVSEPERGRRSWQDKKTGETPPEKAAAQKALYGNRRRVRGRRGRRLQRCRGEVVERTFAHMYETGGMRRVWVRGHENVRKRVLLQAAACNIGLLLRRLTGVGTPRSLQGRAVSALFGLIERWIGVWARLTRA